MKTPNEKLHFFIIDDDAVSLMLLKGLLEAAGHKVTTNKCSTDALTQIKELEPDCILCDLLMPDVDGLDLFQQIKKTTFKKRPKFIIITGKAFEYDKRTALETGIDGYLTKPIHAETLVDDLFEIINNNMTLQFWGTRGTLPVPGKKTLRYGGNTNCITLSIAKKHFFIFDAGTGIKELSNHIIKNHLLPLHAKIFISHPHYDHINGLPFFVPMYIAGNEFEILGTSHNNISMEKLISGQMDSVYFPITMKEFGAKLTFRELKEEHFEVEGLQIQTILLNHPGRCLGARVQHQNKSFCYITDNELYLEDSPHYNQHEVDRLIEFVKDTDVLVIDTTYTDEDYAKKVGWGHSCTSRVADVAAKANVKLLCLYHHDPDEYDKDIDKKVAQARQLLKALGSKTRCIAPKERSKIFI